MSSHHPPFCLENIKRAPHWHSSSTQLFIQKVPASLQPSPPEEGFQGHPEGGCVLFHSTSHQRVGIWTVAEAPCQWTVSISLEYIFKEKNQELKNADSGLGQPGL